ncbi:twin-arginine translocase subunit TatC [Kocuria sp. JC486]|uniref:twin-arginine translocase subunit TatC n=1 Tax=Kocuria sp. JC486 TaxID=1970736 RepID=UPI0032AFEA45
MTEKTRRTPPGDKDGTNAQKAARKKRGRRNNPQAQMALTEHLREFRNRLIISAVATVIGMVGGFFLYFPFMEWLSAPIKALNEQDSREAVLNFGGVGGPFSVMVEVSVILGLILASPVWLYQLWAFITPALHKNEKRYAYAFVIAAVPLFLGGCALGITTLPSAVFALTAFNPDNTANVIDAVQYVRFVLQLVLAIGLACVLPVLLVGLNMIGILPGKTLLRSWRWVVIFVLLLAAIVAPGPDMMVMFYISAPLMALFFLAVGVCLLNDRRRAKKRAKQEATYDRSAVKATSEQELRGIQVDAGE